MADWSDQEHYADSPAVDPTGPDSGAERAVRGASWNDTADALPARQREGDAPIERDDDTGARCARSAAHVVGPRIDVAPAAVLRYRQR